MRGGYIGHVLVFVFVGCSALCFFVCVGCAGCFVVVFVSFAMFAECCGYLLCNVCVLVLLVMS